MEDHSNMPLPGMGVWDDHPLYPRDDWKAEAVNGDTQRGYWTWVRAQIDQNKKGKR